MITFEFGKEKAAVVLEKILLLEENKKYRGRIISKLDKYNYIINQIDFSNLDDKIKDYLIQFVYNDFKNKINNKELPDLFKSYILNVFKTNCKKAKRHLKNRNDASKKYHKIKK